MVMWTALILSYGIGPRDGLASMIIMPPAECAAAIRDTSAAFLATWPDGSMTCAPLTVPYSSPRPKARPEKGS